MTAVLRWEALRILAVVVAAAGVLAMHGLVTGHHGITHLAPPGGTVVAAVAPAASSAAGHASAVVTAALSEKPPSEGASHGCHSGCPEPTPAVVVLCVAVLLSVGTVLARLAGARPGRLAPKTTPPRVVRPPRLVPPRRLDVVAELCISRT